MAFLIQRRRAPRFLQSLTAWLLGASLLGALVAHHFAASLYGFLNQVEPVLLLIAVPVVLTESSLRRAMKITLVMGEVSALIAILTWREGLR